MLFHKKQLIYIISIISIFGLSCKNNADKTNDPPINSDSTKNNTTTQQTNAAAQPYTLDTLSINTVSFNKQKILLSNDEFKQYFKIDSSKTDIWECGDPFTYLDKEWMEKTYGKYDPTKGTYKNFDGKITTFFTGNTQFSSNTNKVLFLESKAKGNKLAILNNNITLDENTTIEDFKKMFPKTEIGPIEEPGVQAARIPIDKNGGDVWIFTFKNNKLDSYTLFWDLC